MNLDIRTADDAAILAVWRFGGYEAVHGTYPGRDRALSLILIRHPLPADEEPPVIEAIPGSVESDLHDIIRAALHIVCMTWSLAVIAAGHVPNESRREDGFTPRGCRVIRRHPFRSAVHCTAPPARRVRSGRPIQDP